VLDSPVKDPSRVFAITMILGCLAGRDSLAAAERVFLTWERADPAHARAFADALKLAPHPSAGALLRSYLSDAEASHRALAAEVLVYRGTATLEQLAQAAVDLPDIASLALPAYALTRHPGASNATHAALSSEHAGLREAAWLAMAYRGAPSTVSVLRTALGGPFVERAAPLLALVGGAHDARAILECVARAPTSALVRALGWAGSLEATSLLIGLLEHENADMHEAAAEALERLTGAGLVDEVPVEPEDIVVPDVPDPPPDTERLRPSLAYEVSDQRDLPEEGSIETLTKPSTDPARWRAYWQEHARSFDVSKRHRRGKLYTPLVSLAELAGGKASPGERRLLQRELVIRTGGFVRFDPHDFVRSQEAALEQWQAPAQRASSTPGTWQTPVRP
jgi:HEAT repeat protein